MDLALALVLALAVALAVALALTVLHPLTHGAFKLELPLPPVPANCLLPAATVHSSLRHPFLPRQHSELDVNV